ncbi:MAG: C40 family peptidase [Clostridia bacterium]|nr:C40 family peptidase [Clostridia bacterium]
MKRIHKFLFISSALLLLMCPFTSYAAITEAQGDDLAEFAKNLIEEGNNRKDENGFPLLTYGLTGSWSKNVEIRNNGYNERLTSANHNGYYYRNGRYLPLGDKWMMDCGTFVTYNLKKSLGLVLHNGSEPWHVQDIYNDARKGKNSQYFEFVYSGVSVGNIDYSKLQKGDVIARITSDGNHGMIYVGDGYIAHANRDMIKTYGDNKVSGFQVNKLNRYFLPGTVVRIMRVKDGIVPEDFVMDGTLTWPDNGETVDLLRRENLIEEEEVVPEVQESGVASIEKIIKIPFYPMVQSSPSFQFLQDIYRIIRMN